MLSKLCALFFVRFLCRVFVKRLHSKSGISLVTWGGVGALGARYFLERWELNVRFPPHAEKIGLGVGKEAVGLERNPQNVHGGWTKSSLDQHSDVSDHQRESHLKS